MLGGLSLPGIRIVFPCGARAYSFKLLIDSWNIPKTQQGINIDHEKPGQGIEIGVAQNLQSRGPDAYRDFSVMTFGHCGVKIGVPETQHTIGQFYRV